MNATIPLIASTIITMTYQERHLEGPFPAVHLVLAAGHVPVVHPCLVAALGPEAARVAVHSSRDVGKLLPSLLCYLNSPNRRPKVQS
jgi:hypothetical protein